MSERLHLEIRDDIATLRLDDGKANAFGFGMLEEIDAALDRAAKEAKALVVIGRPGRFSAGFDLSVIQGGADDVQRLVGAGGRMLMKLYGQPQPVVAACTGHAIAAGALTLLASDTRIGARGDFKIGLNETAIGLSLPLFGTSLASERLSKRHFTAAVLEATLYAPDDAVDAGFLDSACDAADLERLARDEAERLAAYETRIYNATKQRIRGATVRHVLDTLNDDLRNMV